MANSIENSHKQQFIVSIFWINVQWKSVSKINENLYRLAIVWGSQKTPQRFINWSVRLRFARCLCVCEKKGKSWFYTLMMILRNTNIRPFIHSLNFLRWCYPYVWIVWLEYPSLSLFALNLLNEWNTQFVESKGIKHLYPIHLICDMLAYKWIVQDLCSV